MQPLISIITVVRNGEKTIEKTIRSVINQIYSNIEYIIIDGASTDNTRSILSKYEVLFKEQAYKINFKWISEPDSGIYNAMNKGMKLATGDWIYFLGCDDELYNDSVLTELFNNKSYNSKVVYGNVKIIDNAGWAKNNQIYDGQFDLKKIIKQNICHQSIFYHKEIVKQVGFYNENYPVCADWDYNLRCFAQCDFYYVDLIIASFKGGGVSGIKKEELFGSQFADNIFKYFNVRVEDKKYKKIDSPFFQIISSYRKKQAPFTFIKFKILEKLCLMK